MLLYTYIWAAPMIDFEFSADVACLIFIVPSRQTSAELEDA